MSEGAREKEYDDAVVLAHRVLDRISGDPDDDLAILARQFLRAIEPEDPSASAQALIQKWRNDAGAGAVPERDYYDEVDYDALALDIDAYAADKDREIAALRVALNEHVRLWEQSHHSEHPDRALLATPTVQASGEGR